MEIERYLETTHETTSRLTSSSTINDGWGRPYLHIPPERRNMFHSTFWKRLSSRNGFRMTSGAARLIGIRTHVSGNACAWSRARLSELTVRRFRFSWFYTKVRSSGDVIRFWSVSSYDSRTAAIYRKYCCDAAGPAAGL